MNTPASPTSTCLILPASIGDAMTCLRIEVGGRVTSRHPVDTNTRALLQAEERLVLAIPGNAVRSIWLDIPARSEAQAVAAARDMISNQVASADGDLHVVLVPVTDARPRRQALVIAADTLQHWLDSARQTGLEPRVALPDYMLLPGPGVEEEGLPPDDHMNVALHGDQWLVRGHELAFTAEPGLAQAVLGDRSHLAMDVEAVDAALLTGALNPEVNLLQQRFAPRQAAPPGSMTWHRVAVLAGILLLTPLLLAGLEAFRYRLAENTLHEEAIAGARTLHGHADDGLDPTVALQQIIQQTEDRQTLGTPFARLFSAVASIPGMHLDRLEENDERISATVAHANGGDLDTLRDTLADRALSLEVEDTLSRPDGQSSRIRLAIGGTGQ